MFPGRFGVENPFQKILRCWILSGEKIFRTSPSFEEKDRGIRGMSFASHITRELRRSFMNSNQLEGQWKEIKGELKSWWGKLTDDDIEQIAGSKDKLIGVVQQKYGYLYDEAQREIDRRLNEFDEKSHRLRGVNSAVREKARDVAATVSDTVASLKAGTEDVLNSVGSNETFRNLRTDLVQFVRRYPIQSLLIGFGIGYFLSRRSGR
jgi:uncharacterized protein YjbJ (UPF0337 family)